MRPIKDRLTVLIGRISEWEDNPEPEMTKEWIDACRDADELLLDIKDCLESCVRDY